MRPELLDPLLLQEFFERVAEHMDALAARGDDWIFEEAHLGRRSIHNHPFHVGLHEALEPLAGELAGTNVKKSYAFAAMYGEGAMLPQHTDREQCKYTIDLCVSQAQPWELLVDDVEYLLEPNQALFFSGTASTHGRPRIQAGNFCNLVFFHFVDEGFDGPLD